MLLTLYIQVLGMTVVLRLEENQLWSTKKRTTIKLPNLAKFYLEVFFSFRHWCRLQGYQSSWTFLAWWETLDNDRLYIMCGIYHGWQLSTCIDTSCLHVAKHSIKTCRRRVYAQCFIASAEVLFKCRKWLQMPVGVRITIIVTDERLCT